MRVTVPTHAIRPHDRLLRGPYGYQPDEPHQLDVLGTNDTFWPVDAADYGRLTVMFDNGADGYPADAEWTVDRDPDFNPANCDCNTCCLWQDARGL